MYDVGAVLYVLYWWDDDNDDDENLCHQVQPGARWGCSALYLHLDAKSGQSHHEFFNSSLFQRYSSKMKLLLESERRPFPHLHWEQLDHDRPEFFFSQFSSFNPAIIDSSIFLLESDTKLCLSGQPGKPTAPRSLGAGPVPPALRPIRHYYQVAGVVAGISV